MLECWILNHLLLTHGKLLHKEDLEHPKTEKTKK